ncbi:MAG: B12-binding domain-containing radical SAM protein [Thermoplasmatales archaeon]|nr:B12-binding domain-containing radical SAM protein [Thermoplasmatales archaeon]MCW6170168.1 B12-binding domain-containing radical SAM protein [Thermoplasmatales archaeon]
MTKFVLVSDSTLSYEYRNFPLLDFLPCAPSKAIPYRIYSFLKGPAPPAMPNGELVFAPYAIRKLEAALLRKYDKKDIAVAHEDYLENFIKDDTEIIGVSTMDPLGIGPTTMSYYALFGGEMMAWVRWEWDHLIEKINRIRAGKKAKLVVGGPGVWEFTVLNDEIEKYHFDYVVQGETDDIAEYLFDQMSTGDIDNNMFYRGYMTYDDRFRKILQKDDRFLARGITKSAYPRLEEIPEIVRPSMKGMVEVMRGCGVGCDFCEVTLRPLRYSSVQTVVNEIKVNQQAGITNAWLHSDEIFGYKHGNLFAPNEEALSELFTAVMGVPGIKTSNPTHGRISIPVGYPEMMEKLSKILKTGPSNWIGIQTGVETGSDSLAKRHMPNKTLPLRIGPDGTWEQIVWQGVFVETANYWRPAFTIQVGQEGETTEDLWDTVAMVNRLSNSYSTGRPFEFTVTPLVNVPLGRIKSRNLNKNMLTVDQLAVYYASYRHLAKMANRDGYRDTHGNFISRAGTGTLISGGGMLMMKFIEHLAKKSGVDIEKVKRYGIENKKSFTSLASLSGA